MRKKKLPLKREYLPVYISSATLGILVISLIGLLLFDKTKFDVDTPKQEYIKNEMLVDTSNSLCSIEERKEIQKLADDIEMVYSPYKTIIDSGISLETGEEEEVEGYVYKVEFKNLTDDMFIIVTNDNEDSTKPLDVLKAKDGKDGVVTYKTDSTSYIVTYTVRIYTKHKNCENEMFRKFTFTTPIYNRYHDMDMCQAYPEFEMCQKFIDFDRPSLSEFKVALYEWGEKEDIVITNLYEKLYGTTTTIKGGTTVPLKDLTAPKPLSEEEKKKNEEIAEEKRKKREEKLDAKTIYIIIGIGTVLVAGCIVAIVIKKKRNRI